MSLSYCCKVVCFQNYITYIQHSPFVSGLAEPDLNNLFFQQEAVSKAGDLISRRTLEQFWKETTMIIQKYYKHNFLMEKMTPPPLLHTYY